MHRPPLTPLRCGKTKGLAPSRVLLSAILVVSACAQPPAQSPFATRDSAGVTIAVSTAPRWQAAPSEAWVVSEDPTLDLSATGSGPDHEFYRVADIARLLDGRIAVANSGSHQIRIYSSQGEHIASTGREGEGPGEFARFFNLDRLPGDTLLVHTYPSKITILSPELELVRTFDLDPLARRLHAFAGGILGSLGTPMEESREGNEQVRLPETLVRFDASGGASDTIMTMPGSEAFLFMSEFGLSGGRPLFHKQTEVAVTGEGLVVGFADSLAYDIRSRDGDLIRRVRVSGVDLSLSRSEVAEELAARVGPNPDPFTKAMHEALPIPRTRAAYENLLVDATGHLWAGVQPSWTERRERAPRDWNVFSPEGEWLGVVTTPGDFTPFEIGAEHLLGVRFDEMDLEHVQVLEIRKP